MWLDIEMMEITVWSYFVNDMLSIYTNWLDGLDYREKPNGHTLDTIVDIEVMSIQDIFQVFQNKEKAGCRLAGIMSSFIFKVYRFSAFDSTLIKAVSAQNQQTELKCEKYHLTWPLIDLSDT